MFDHGILKLRPSIFHNVLLLISSTHTGTYKLTVNYLKSFIISEHMQSTKISGAWRVQPLCDDSQVEILHWLMIGKWNSHYSSPFIFRPSQVATSEPKAALS